MDSYTIELVLNGLYFLLAAFFAMVYGFARQWMTNNDSRNLYQYLLGDLRKTGLAISILFASVATALGFDFLANNTPQQLVMLGIGIGLAVPAKFQLEVKKLSNEKQGNEND